MWEIWQTEATKVFDRHKRHRTSNNQRWYSEFATVSTALNSNFNFNRWQYSVRARQRNGSNNNKNQNIAGQIANNEEINGARWTLKRPIHMQQIGVMRPNAIQYYGFFAFSFHSAVFFAWMQFWVMMVSNKSMFLSRSLLWERTKRKEKKMLKT